MVCPRVKCQPSIYESSELGPEIRQWVMSRRKIISAELITLIDKDTVSPLEKAIIPELSDAFGDIGFITHLVFAPPNFTRHERYVTAAGQLGPGRLEHDFVLRARAAEPAAGKRTVLFNTHLDVVPADQNFPQAFSAKADERGHVYGRGAVDAKGNIVMLLEALRFLRFRGIPAAKNVTISLVSAEEITGNGTLLDITEGLDADAVVVLEPTGLQVHAGHRGCLSFQVDVTGSSCHMGDASKGQNAVEAILSVAARIADLERQLLDAASQHPRFGRWPTPLKANISRIAGGEWHGSVARNAWLSCNFGYIPPTTAAQLEASIRRLVTEVSQASGVRASVTFGGLRNDAYLQPDDSPLAVGLRRACGQAGIDMAPLQAWCASCDAHHYHRAGLPTVIFGCGQLAQAHSDSEHLDLDQLGAGAEALVRFLLDDSDVCE